MKGYKIFIYVLLPIFIFMVYPGFQYAFWYGWHTVIFTEKSYATFLVIGFIFGVVFLYWILEKNGIQYGKIFILIHFLLTMLPIYLLFFFKKIVTSEFNKGTIAHYVDLGIRFLEIQVLSYFCFILGQIIFLVAIESSIWRKLTVHRHLHK